MNVISIDPAPSKDAVIFDGSFRRCTARELPSFCIDLAAAENLLVCWDAPLTGPPPTSVGRSQSPYSQRLIEQFFSRAATGFKTPGGISVLPYSGCPHWAITRASVGLPYVGKFDLPLAELPFQLVSDNTFSTEKGKWIVETHPAVAIWLWCKDDDDYLASWVYKGRKASRTIQELFGILTGIWSSLNIPDVTTTIRDMAPPTDDDELDSVVGWVLGKMLIHNHPAATVLGTLSTGAMVLPCCEIMIQRFNTFLQENAT